MQTNQLIQGLHHVTATTDEAQEDLNFYTHFLGLRLVKKTVNFDDYGVYHFYYGTKTGEPGAIMTTFPYHGRNVRRGKIGSGQVTTTSFSVPVPALDFWRGRLNKFGLPYSESTRFGKTVLEFDDPSGLRLALVGNTEDSRMPWLDSPDIHPHHSLQGLYNVRLSLHSIEDNLPFLCDELGFKEMQTEGNTIRCEVGAFGGPGCIVDLQHEPDRAAGKNGIGTVHHVAFRLPDLEALRAMRHRLADELGMKVTEIKERKYFQSVYFRIPGDVLFELATTKPGFTADEPEEKLGSGLMLPQGEEENRKAIEEKLEKVVVGS